MRSSIHSLLMLMLGSLAFFCCASGSRADSEVLLEDDFSGLSSGLLFTSVVGAHGEYHYLAEMAPKGNWAVSCYTSDPLSQRAWRVQRDRGHAEMVQTYQPGSKKKRSESHPMIVAGDPLWTNYTVSVRFAPAGDRSQSGLAFRYQNDRCYYFFGVSGSNAILKMVHHGTGYHQPYEKILAEGKCSWKPGQYLTATVAAIGSRLRAELDGGIVLEADDATYAQGKVALTADVPTRYSLVKVTATPAEKQQFQARAAARQKELESLRAANPRPVVWKKIKIDGFGVGRNLRFGDLDGDGQIDVLVGQVEQHGPKDQYCELSCLTAMTFDGKLLWQTGLPDLWHNHLTNDVAFQIYDLDGDGRNEVIYCMNFEIVVADGATGKVKHKAPTPTTNRKGARYPRILGDSLLLCDLRGSGRPRDIILKDRYWQIWALNDRLEVMWQAECTTGHYPYAYDVDGDGKDELLAGYTLFDHDGKKLWSHDDSLGDHADAVAIAKLRDDLPLRILTAASDEGMLFLDLQGKLLAHHYLGHVQSPAVAKFRGDLPGLQAVSVNYWGNQGILHFYDAEGNVYHSCEPNQRGSMCLPINWTGKPEEYFVHSANVDEGGMFDGWGRCVVVFPDDGHPDMCNAVLDLTGDCRDEVVVWDPYEIWVYTQSDNPKPGRLYKPVRNPLYNYSNYQATVSLPGWSK